MGEMADFYLEQQEEGGRYFPGMSQPRKNKPRGRPAVSGPTIVMCDYCGKPAALVTGQHVYPHRPDLAHLKIYECAPCDARVGCHPSTTRPLGRLANAELRRAKSQAHAAFDPSWKSGFFTRTAAYKWLSKQLGIPVTECHIGEFDIDMCRRVVQICQTGEEA